ncbi:GNAT family N-acetyltransferase [Chryseobacterium aquaticum]|uniref:GNAT family acetyltransferase n=1 Tax=Chryseobacterium aquaticum subsp. greenlandense TaxID=345663 RepID=A0A101CH48_9FLAO|nr:GNAT family N-acetyltransferase [Chryseobacterium aquaticum]KUJ56142.1 GNAT family acetyltransferase [Chryseobacterium aquaticum subsp. greenlandense]
MENYFIKQGFENMDVKAIHSFLIQSYWAAGISIDTVEASLRNSFCVGIFESDNQVGFARLITDYATFAYLADVYILDKHRRKGLSNLLMDYLFNLEWTQKLRRILLVTLDAHFLYKKIGFDVFENPEMIMEIKRNSIYHKRSE